MAHTGRCLCGTVRYAVEGELGPPFACHCQYCRRAHGSPFYVGVLVPRAGFRFTRGEADVRAWPSPTSPDQRVFCSQCGTRLLNRGELIPDSLALVAATLDLELDQPPAAHLNVESKAPWYEICDDAPQHPGHPPGVGPEP